MANPYSGYYGTQGDGIQGYYPQQEQYLSQLPAVASQNTAGANPTGSGGIGGLGAMLQTGFGIWEAIKAGRDRKKFEKLAESELNSSPVYQESPYARQQLAQAQAQQNAINPAVQAMERNAQIGAANVASAGQRNAMSGAEAINAAIAGQAQANAMYPQIANLQTEYNARNQGLLANAMQNMTNEYQNVFNDRVRRNDTRLNYRLGQLSGANARKGDSWRNIIGGVTTFGSGIEKALTMGG